MSAERPFIDSNVVVYAASADARKADIATRILNNGGMVSVQVLNETANVLRKKARLEFDEIVAFVDIVRALVDVTPLTVETHQKGLDIAKRHQLSVYDGMIVSAAAQAGATTVLSEDMGGGAVLAGIRVVNPFAPAPDHPPLP